jgi:hypothetical protein
MEKLLVGSKGASYEDIVDYPKLVANPNSRPSYVLHLP